LAEVHLVAGVAVMALNLAAGLWGAVAWGANRASVWFWYVLRAAQVSVVVQVLLGAVLLIAGREAADGIHYMYGTAPLVVNLFAEGMRAGAAQREVPEDVEFESLPATEQRTIALRIVRREMGIMTVAALLIVAFAIRAAQVSGKMF
jgi:ABC-type phosphate transport system auxiliary subunit